ncbi:ABC transporter permease [Haloprofundus salinisoli]|uniref:ABC transporter permease n=1 Tax=Haloprofundus salinisoli TaxID=2876193 RepID=UPI00295EA912|nr:ABC transporter permease [Haloprofundus salinisoli]
MNDILQYVVKRLLWAVPVLLGASFVAFIMVHLAPGDPARLMLGERASAAQVEQLRIELGLNQPLYVQYMGFLGDAIQGDLGRSIRSQQPVTDLIVGRLPYTIQLAVSSLVVSLAIALPTGILGALRKGRLTDHVSRIVALLGISMPNFWLGLILIVVVAVELSSRFGIDAFPLFGMTLVTEDPVEGMFSVVLPALALGTALAALVMRMIRGGVLDEINQSYVRTARAYGISEGEITYVYVLKNAILPTITVVGLQLGYLIGGSVIVETVFGIPGIGQLAINSIFAQDFPVIQGIVLLVAVAFVASNLLVDVLYGFLDPRIRYGGENA